MSIIFIRIKGKPEFALVVPHISYFSSPKEKVLPNGKKDGWEIYLRLGYAEPFTVKSLDKNEIDYIYTSLINAVEDFYEKR